MREWGTREGGRGNAHPARRRVGGAGRSRVSAPPPPCPGRGGERGAAPPARAAIASLRAAWAVPLDKGDSRIAPERSDGRSGGGCSVRRGSTLRRPALLRRAALLALLLAAGGAEAQSARLYVLADTVEAGERFEVAVAVDHAPGRQTAFPDVPPVDPEAAPLLAFGDAEAFAVRRLPPTVRGRVRTDSAVYTVAAFAVDSARVGPVTVRVGGGADTASVSTGVAVLPVRSLLEGAPPYEPAPLGPPDDFPSAAPVWIALGVLGALVLGGAAWWAIRVLRQPREQGGVAPYPAALARLAALDQEAPRTPAEVEAHVVAVRAVLRAYLAGRLGLPALESTTAELDADLRADARVPGHAADAVRAALLPADLVAFAGARPAPPAVAALRDRTRAAVEAVEGGMGDGEGWRDGQNAGRDPSLIPHPPSLPA